MDNTQFNGDCVKAINAYRRNHGVGSLSLNSEMSRIAQDWADELMQKNKMSHSGLSYRGKMLGENIYTKWTSNRLEVSASEAVDSWYNEIKQYDFETGKGRGTGHFTQLVWKGSREIGVGKAVSPDGRSTFVVTNYHPQGNIIGQYLENVLRPRSGSNNNNNSTVSTDKPKQGFLQKLFHTNNQNSTPVQTAATPKSELVVQTKPKVICHEGRRDPVPAAAVHSSPWLSSQPAASHNSGVVRSTGPSNESYKITVQPTNSSGPASGSKTWSSNSGALVVPISGSQNLQTEYTRTVTWSSTPGNQTTSWSYRSETTQNPSGSNGFTRKVECQTTTTNHRQIKLSPPEVVETQ